MLLDHQSMDLVVGHRCDAPIGVERMLVIQGSMHVPIRAENFFCTFSRSVKDPVARFLTRASHSNLYERIAMLVVALLCLVPRSSNVIPLMCEVRPNRCDR